MNRAPQLTPIDRPAQPSSRPTVPVAVIVTAHGAARFLPEALAGIHDQTAAPAETVVVDDTSPGADALRVIDMAGVARLRHPLGPNVGRNVAILEARQPWIAFLDSEDAWVPHKLAAQWRAVEACPGLDVVFANFWEVSEARRIKRPFLEQKAHYWEVERRDVAPGLKECERRSLVRQFLKGNFLARSTLLVRRDVLVRVGLFERDLVHLEDRDCWLRLLAVARFGVLEEPLMYGRLDEDVSDPDRRRWPYEEALDAVRLWQLMATHPTDYPPEAVALYEAERWRPSLTVGRLAEADGLLRAARRHYLRAWWLGGGAWPLIRAAASYLPAPVRHGLLRIRSRLRRG
jgi:glycosyltransferase involved in cell wall biosynthesis